MGARAHVQPLHVVYRCDEALFRKARYVFDTLLIARDIPVIHSAQPPETGPWIQYGGSRGEMASSKRCVNVLHQPQAWSYLSSSGQAALQPINGLPALAAPVAHQSHASAPDIAFDLAASAFFFLSSWAERSSAGDGARRRHMHADSVFAKSGVPQDIVDRYLDLLVEQLDALCDRLQMPRWRKLVWPAGALYAVVLSHDVDFIPAGRVDTFKQGIKSVMRDLVRHRDPADAALTASGFVRAIAARRDPYGCIPEIIARERQLGVKSSFQVATGRRHPSDVNYSIEDDRTRDYLRAITDAGFDLCLHGSYRSTDHHDWYVEEAAWLARRLARPMGSRQHFLSFDYDTLFSAQESAGIEYDMSLGYPDQTGSRVGFSYPFYPYCLKEDRPYRVLQISLMLMDVTLRSYLRLKAKPAGDVTHRVIAALKHRGGCGSVVWHPIVFGGARDPGYDRLYWNLVEHTGQTGGIATDGRTINTFWRSRTRVFSTLA
jgi:hypothetical protein